MKKAREHLLSSGYKYIRHCDTFGNGKAKNELYKNNNGDMAILKNNATISYRNA